MAVTTATVGSTSSSIAMNVTKSGLYLSTLGYDMLQKVCESNDLGSLAIGTGATNIPNGVQNDGSKIFVYFYKAKATGLNASGLPDFINDDLSINEALLVAYASNQKVADTSKPKEGIVTTRLGSLALLTPLAGLAYLWAQGYGTGEFDSVAISCCDLLNLRTMSTIPKVFFGKAISGSAENADLDGNYFIKPGITNLTDANTLLIKMPGYIAWKKLNLLTGDIIAYDGTLNIDWAKPCWGSNQVVIDGILYFIGYEYFSQYSAKYVVHKMDLSNGSGNWGSEYSYVGNGATLDRATFNLLKIGSELYVSNASVDVISLNRVDKSSLGLFGDKIDVTIPTEWRNGLGIITNSEDGAYLLTVVNSGITYKFTDLANPLGTCTKVYFTGGSAVTPITVGSALYFVSGVSKGVFSALAGATSSFGAQAALIDAECTPLLSWGKASALFTKAETDTLTSMHYFKGNILAQ